MKKHIKAFVHDSVLNPGDQRGVDRCFTAYTQALAQAFPRRVVILSARCMNLPGAYLVKPPSSYCSLLRGQDNRFGQALADLSSEIFYSPYYGCLRTKIPQVFTAYDMIMEKCTPYFPEAIKDFIRKKKDCFERAALILCISHNTARDLLETYPQIPERKVRVVHIGVDRLFFDEARHAPDGKPYFLFVGKRGAYKNFYRLLRAFGRSQLCKDFSLHVVAPDTVQFSPEELDVIRQFALAGHVTAHSGIEDRELHRLYSGAFAFVYPSEYEGFGLPPLEAMASGTLVLCSSASAMPEICADIPLYFDPRSEDAIMQALHAAAGMSAADRSHIIERGKARAALFTWEASQHSFVQEILSVG